MKNRGNQILLAAFFITTALYVYALLPCVGAVPGYSDLWIRLDMGLWFHAVPCFCLQLLICRVAERLVIRFIPVFLLAGIVTMFFLFLATSTGWDTWAWSIMLLMCAAPAVGYALAWAAYGIQYAYQHNSN